MAEPQHDFTGRRVLVCGGTSGLGLAAAHAFADAGAEVAVTGRHTHTALYDAALDRFELVPLDLADRESIARVAAGVARPDTLVVAEPPQPCASSDPHEREFLAQASHLGLVGPVHLAMRLRFRLAQSTMRGGGSVVLLPSLHEWLGMGRSAAEARAEALACTQRLAASCAALGVRVNTVLDRHAGTGPGSLRVQIDRQSGPLLTRPRPPRTTTMRAATDLTVYLASSGAAALTGQVLTVDSLPG